LQILALFVLRQDPFGQRARAFGQDCRHAMWECNSRALRPRHALVEIFNSSWSKDRLGQTKGGERRVNRVLTEA
jgi:hypothetical protein